MKPAATHLNYDIIEMPAFINRTLDLKSDRLTFA
jgi:hypothetical protein